MKKWQIEFIYNDVSWKLGVGGDLYSALKYSKDFNELLEKQIRTNAPEQEVKKQWEDFFTKKKMEGSA